MRVHELAKELGTSSKELLAQLRSLDIEAKSHMSNLDEAAIQLIREHPAPGAAAEEPEPEPPAEAAPAAEPEPEPEPEPAPEVPVDGKVIKVKGAVSVKELADRLAIRPNELVAELMGMNVFASINERVDVNVARKIAEKHGFELEHEKRAAEHKLTRRKSPDEEEEQEDAPEDLLPRGPVVTFLGHVDHGKTSLLDKIRDTSVTEGESGGITQHIGAYTVEVGGQKITFLDTPGHAAFTAMRARGANLTDIAVIIIAADDGIMPQTREAISHAKAAGVSLIVAINKIDLPTANVDRAKQQLQAEGMAPEDWGGEMICVPVSAQTGEGIDHLLEMILLQAEMLELKANPNRRAGGFVIEAQMEAGTGPTANLLVTRGTLKVGDLVLSGQYYGRVRALINDHGAKVKSAGPATPVKCLGLSGVPEAGASFRTCASDKVARAAAEHEALAAKDQQLATPKKGSLEDLFAQIEETQKLELKVILKADTQGSVEAIVQSLQDIQSDKVALSIILSSPGNITVNDVMLASASSAVILGFHIALEPGVAASAKHEGVEIHLHMVIYELIDQVRRAMLGLLEPELKENVVGVAEVKQVFNIGKTGKIAGCLVTSGRIAPRLRARVKRNDEVLFEGHIATLKHFQDEVSEVRESQECGIRLDNFADFEEGDALEFYEMEELERSL